MSAVVPSSSSSSPSLAAAADTHDKRPAGDSFSLPDNVEAVLTFDRQDGGTDRQPFTLHTRPTAMSYDEARRLLRVEVFVPTCDACASHLLLHVKDGVKGRVYDGRAVRLRLMAYGAHHKNIYWTGGANTPCGSIRQHFLAALGLTDTRKHRYDVYLGPEDLMHPMPHDASFGEWVFARIGMDLTELGVGASANIAAPLPFSCRLVRRY